MEENHREILVVSNAKGKKFSLIETDNNYIVACGYSDLERWGRQWEHGIYYMFSNDKEKLVALNEATEKLFEKVNADYIARCRLEELATLFKDGLISDDRESAMEYFDEICEMTDEEKEWFGIEEDSSTANTKYMDMSTFIKIGNRKEAYKDYCEFESGFDDNCRTELSYEEFCKELNKGYGNSYCIQIARLYEDTKGVVWYDNEYI